MPKDYDIINRTTIGQYGVVFAQRKSEFYPAAAIEPNDDPARYVTWEFRIDTPEDFYWGHYFSDVLAAQRDFQARVMKLLDYDWALYETDYNMMRFIESGIAIGLANGWNDNEIIEALMGFGLGYDDFIKTGYGDFVKEYFEEE